MESKVKTTTFSYVHALKEELKKVSWTNKAELRFCTKLVVGAIFCFGLGIYGADLMVRGVLDLFGITVRFLFGGWHA